MVCEHTGKTAALPEGKKPAKPAQNNDQFDRNRRFKSGGEGSGDGGISSCRIFLGINTLLTIVLHASLTQLTP